MSQDIYAPPESDTDFSAADVDGVQFYVVGIRKFLILSIVTMNLYFVYWFWRNWRDVKVSTGDSIWPIPRAIFYIFFTHSLLGLADDQLSDKKTEFSWSYRSVATIFVVLAVVSAIVGNLSSREIGSPFTDFVPLVLSPILAVLLGKGQQAINIAMDDPDGSANKSLTVANWVWLVIGGLFWLMTLFGLYVLYGAPEQFQ